ncbi:hypothetical protein AB0M43_13525 [Longispora sp. NPDC051575]|uniref:hypothetical protein n=1 Tax=Longispora sp. NPDC051575 TaxID=3154943 RepID=UPI0034327F55
MLERRYRALLRAYPSEFRAEHGDQLVATLLDGARPGQTHPTLGDTADLVGSGLRRRLGLDRHAGVETGLRLAAPVALFLLTCLSGVELMTRGWELRAGFPATWWVYFVAGTTVVWLVAALGWAVLPRTVGRVLVGVALAGTVSGQFVSGLTSTTLFTNDPNQGRSMSPATFGAYALLGAVAFLGTRDSVTRVPVRLLAVAGGLGWAALSVTDLTGRGGIPGGVFRWDAGDHSYGYVKLVGYPLLPALCALAAMVAAGLLAHRRRGASGWLWAAAVLLLPATWLAMPWFLTLDDWGAEGGTFFLSGHATAPLQLLGAAGVLFLAVRSGATRALGAGAVTTVALGVGAAVSAVLLPFQVANGDLTPMLAGHALMLLAAAAWRWWPAAVPYLAVPASAAFLAMVWWEPSRTGMALAGVLLAPVALAGLRERPARPAVWSVAAVALLLAPLLFTVPEMVFTDPAAGAAGGAEAFATLWGYLAVTVPALVIVPFALAVFVGADRVLRADRGMLWALVGLFGGGTWFLLVTLHGEVVPTVVLIVAAGAGVLLARRLRARAVVRVTDTEPVL